MSTLSFNAKRLIVGVAALVPLFCITNSFWDFHVFGRFDKTALVMSFVFIAVVTHFFGPSLEEIRHYRDTKRLAKKG